MRDGDTDDGRDRSPLTKWRVAVNRATAIDAVIGDLPQKFSRQEVKQVAAAIAVAVRRKKATANIYLFLYQLYGQRKVLPFAPNRIAQRIAANLDSLVAGYVPDTGRFIEPGLQAGQVLAIGKLTYKKRLSVVLQVRLITGQNAGVTVNIPFSSTAESLIARDLVGRRTPVQEIVSLHGAIIGLDVTEGHPRPRAMLVTQPDMQRYNRSLLRSRVRTYTPCPLRKLIDCAYCKLSYVDCSISPWEIPDETCTLCETRDI